MTDKKQDEPQQHADIWAALLAAQPNFTKPKKQAENKHFGNKYADLEADIDAVLPALNSAGIVYQCYTVSSELGLEVHTVLRHPASGTSDTYKCPLLLGKQDMQALKGARTYARRIGIEDICGLAPGEDDDGNAAASGSDMGAALRDAWRQSVEDNFPENATPRQKAEAYADAICDDFKGKGEKALENRWNKHKGLISQFESRFPDLHEKVQDAYLERQNELHEAKSGIDGNRMRAVE